MQGAGDKYSNFKKNVGPPNYQFNPRYMPIEHNDYLKKKGVSLNEVKQFEPRVVVDSHAEHHH